MKDEFRTFSVRHRHDARKRPPKPALHRDDRYYDTLSTARQKGYRARLHLSMRFIDRWLLAQVGRHWDKVYSEICEEYDHRTRRGRRIRQEVSWVVDQNCFIDEKGEIRTYQGYQGDHGSRQFSYFPKAHGLFVHPKSGILSYRDIENPSDYVRDEKTITYIPLQDGSSYRLLDCNTNRGPRDQFKAWFHYAEEKTERRYFSPASAGDIEWYRNQIETSTPGYANRTLEDVLRRRGYEIVAHKGEMV